MAVTINDIAKELNLSKSTVSYALNGGPRSVSPELRQRVLESAKALGYRVNPWGQALAAKRSRTIGFAPNRFDSSWMFSQFASSMLSNLYAVAHERGLHLLLPSGYDPNHSEETREQLFTAPVDGYILLTPSAETIAEVSSAALPMIAVACPPNLTLPTVSCDNKGGTRLAIQHLLGLGHRNIGIIGSTQAHDTNERFETFLEFRRKGLIHANEEWIIDAGPMFEDGYRGALRLLTLSNLPTAVICVNDLVACACMRIAYSKGMSVPKDLSIVGFDDDTVASTSAIPLTTIQQPIPEMAIAALEGVLSRIGGIEISNSVLPTKLIVRTSTSSPMKEYI